MCQGTEVRINELYLERSLTDLVREYAQLPGSLKHQDSKLKACKFKANPSNLPQNKK